MDKQIQSFSHSRASNCPDNSLFDSLVALPRIHVHKFHPEIKKKILFFLDD